MRNLERFCVRIWMLFFTCSVGVTLQGKDHELEWYWIVTVLAAFVAMVASMFVEEKP